MITLDPSTPDDIEQIKEWVALDPYHFHQSEPEWWLTAAQGSLLAFCLKDALGPLIYVRLDMEGEYIRLNAQFAPESVAEKRRLVVGLLECMHKLIEFYTGSAKGIVFASISPALIDFMDRNLGFKAVGNNDYQLDFEGK